MKKIIYSLSALLLAFSVNAQDSTKALVSKRGVNILPEAGEFAIGFSATPLLNYFGNFLNQAGTNAAPTVAYPSAPGLGPVGGGLQGIGGSVIGKKMLDDNTALRVRFSLNKYAQKDKFVVAKDLATPDPMKPEYVEDVFTTSGNNLLLAAGIEKRRGKTRVQGVYGGELMLGYAKYKVKADYGNPMNANFNNPTSTAFPGLGVAPSGRYTEYNMGSRFFFGARAFAGVEYFFAPKVSIGGELGYTLGFSAQGKSTVENEIWNSTSTQSVETRVDPSNNTTFVGIGLDNVNANLNLFFYF